MTDTHLPAALQQIVHAVDARGIDAFATVAGARAASFRIPPHA